MSSGGQVGGFAEGSKGKSKSKSKVRIPKFLRPFMEQSLGIASGALDKLEEAGSGDLVADLNDLQQAGLGQAIDVAQGAGGFLPTAQQTFMNAAQGFNAEDAFDPTALSAMRRASEGQGLDSFIPQNALAGLNTLAAGNVNAPGNEALRQTAAGDFLFGGQGFDQAVQAAVNAASPQIASAFGGTQGGLSGSSAKQAVGQSAIDAFASQFGQERQNQLNAANALNAQQLQAMLAGSSGLAGLGGDERSRQLATAGQLAGLTGEFTNQDLMRRLQAAGQLPQLGLASSNIFQDVGNILQGQAQREISAPIDFQTNLFQTALGIPSIASPFLGQRTIGDTQTFAQGVQASGGK